MHLTTIYFVLRIFYVVRNYWFGMEWHIVCLWVYHFKTRQNVKSYQVHNNLKFSLPKKKLVLKYFVWCKLFRSFIHIYNQFLLSKTLWNLYKKDNDVSMMHANTNVTNSNKIFNTKKVNMPSLTFSVDVQYVILYTFQV